MEFDEEGRVACPECHGERIILMNSVELHQVCPTCNGVSGMDWVSRTMRASSNISDQVQYENIRRLVDVARSLAHRIGYKLDVSLIVYHRDHEAEMIRCQQYFNQVYKNGGV